MFRVQSRLDTDRIAALRNLERAVLVFGPDAAASDVTESLDALGPHDGCRSIVLTSERQLAGFQELIDSDRVFYLSCGELPARDLDALIDSALATKQANIALDQFLGAVNLRRIAMAQSVTELADALRAAVASVVDAGSTRCVLFDSERNVLWVPGESDGESTSVGLISFILRTGATACVPRLGDDARFDPDLDGAPSDRWIGVPVYAHGSTTAVLVATRSADQPPFEPVDVAAMEALAAHASPYVAAWLGEPDDPDTPFRRRALRELHHPMGAGAEPLQLDQTWTRRATWLVLATFAALLIAFVAWKGWLP